MISVDRYAGSGRRTSADTRRRTPYPAAKAWRRLLALPEPQVLQQQTRRRVPIVVNRSDSSDDSNATEAWQDRRSASGALPRVVSPRQASCRRLPQEVAIVPATATARRPGVDTAADPRALGRRSPSSRRRCECSAARRPSPPRGLRAARGAAGRGRRAGSPRSPSATRSWPATLRDARDQVVALKEEVDRLAQPPSGYGVFLRRVRRRHGRRVHRRPQAAGRGLARDRDRRAPARPGGHAQRGAQRRRGARVRAGRRRGDAQGDPRGRRPRAGHRAHRRGADRAPRRHADRPSGCAPATRCCWSPARATSTNASPRARSRS